MSFKILNKNDPVTKEYLSLIGEVVVNFNFLESRINFWIWEMISAHSKSGHAYEIQKVGRKITAPLEFKPKIDLLDSLVFERFEKKQREFHQQVYKKLESCAHRRNDILHSEWFIQYGNIKENIPLSTHKINQRKLARIEKFFGSSKISEDVSKQDLRNFLNMINEADTYLENFFIS